jgi:hypothetical protein
MACKSPLGNPAIPLCALSLRRLSTETYPGDHLTLVDPTRWTQYNKRGEGCMCDTPNMAWTISPLGAAVEVGWGTANHHLCLTEPYRTDLDLEPLRLELLPHAHPGIAAEAFFARRRFSEFVSLVTGDPRAAAHVLSLPKSFGGREGLLAEAQHFVRAALLHEAAAHALEEI